VSPELLDALIPHIECDPNITYYVINRRGDLRTNSHSDGPNAVTWGVFPGKEIIQPTIVEAISFMAWKVYLYEVFLAAYCLIHFYRMKPTNWVANGPSTMRLTHPPAS
jgi:hypothetical protein